MFGGKGKSSCILWIGDFKKEGALAKKLAKKAASIVK